jgi:drug/metabolite transporter (DMT)-like permease
MFALLRVFVRLASIHAPWAEVAVLRTVTSVVVSFALAHAIGASLRIERRADAWGRSLFGTVGLLLLYYVLSEPGINVGDVAVLSATSPVFVALVAPLLLGERTSPALWLCVAISFAGILFIAQPSLDTAGALMLLTLASAITSGMGNVFMRRLGPYAAAEAIVLHFGVVSAIALLAIAVWTWRWPSVTGWMLMAATGIVGALGQIAQTRAYALVPAAWIGVFGYISIVFTQLIAVIVLGEAVGLPQILGSMLIIGAGLILVRTSTRRAQAAATPAGRPP